MCVFVFYNAHLKLGTEVTGVLGATQFVIFIEQSHKSICSVKLVCFHKPECCF